jgi:two-component system response regulator HupR/HoxA
MKPSKLDTTSAEPTTKQAQAPARRRLLLVDDDPSVLETATAILEADYDVTACADGFQALELLRAQPFDVVCTDYAMPGMSGTDLLESISKLGMVLGVILVTGRAEAYYEEQRARSCDARVPFRILTKPYAPEALIETVERASAFTRTRRAANAIGSGR